MTERMMYWRSFWWGFFHPLASDRESLAHSAKLAQEFVETNGK